MNLQPNNVAVDLKNFLNHSSVEQPLGKKIEAIAF